MNTENSLKSHPAVMLAAPKSGSGKTLITCALLEALKERGFRLQAFKCGPDFIDPLFHREILGVPSVNLDTWFSGRDGAGKLFRRHLENADIGIIEGVMGLYDGLGGITEEASSYDLACALHVPVILIVDAGGMGRSVIAEIRGFLLMDEEHLIKGVLLNKTSRSFASLIAPEIERLCGIPVVGCFPKQKDLKIESRYLGLKLPEEIEDLKEEVKKAAGILEQNADVERILSIAGADGTPEKGKTQAVQNKGEKSFSLRIAAAKDEAFCFYYEDNLNLLKSLGAEPVFFSPLGDHQLPENIDGIYLCGGYPELWAEKLSANAAMREAIRNAIRNGLPSAAECGGFMYLQEEIVTPDGVSHPMCGVISGRSYYTGHLVRFGYCAVREKDPVFLPAGQEIRGHEFHYYDSDDNGTDCTAAKPVSGKSWDCVRESRNSFWGYPHLYWPSNPAFAEHFVSECRKYHSRQRGEQQ